MTKTEIEKFLHICKISKLLILDYSLDKTFTKMISDLIDQPIIDLEQNMWEYPINNIIYIINVNKFHTPKIFLPFDCVISYSGIIIKNRHNSEKIFNPSDIEAYSRKLKLQKILI